VERFKKDRSAGISKSSSVGTDILFKTKEGHTYIIDGKKESPNNCYSEISLGFMALTTHLGTFQHLGGGR